MLLPKWWLTSNAPPCESIFEKYKNLFNTDKRLSSKDTIEMREKRSLIVKWKFSTNRVIIKGSNGFDCIFGPWNETQAHATNEIS